MATQIETDRTGPLLPPQHAAGPCSPCCPPLLQWLLCRLLVCRLKWYQGLFSPGHWAWNALNFVRFLRTKQLSASLWKATLTSCSTTIAPSIWLSPARWLCMPSTLLTWALGACWTCSQQKLPLKTSPALGCWLLGLNSPRSSLYFVDPFPSLYLSSLTFVESSQNTPLIFL